MMSEVDLKMVRTIIEEYTEMSNDATALIVSSELMGVCECVCARACACVCKEGMWK